MTKRRNYTTGAQAAKRKLYGEIERHHLEALIDLISKSRPNHQFEFIPSPLNRAVPYDGLLHIKDENGFIIKRIIIEAKVRTADYQSYFLEKQKYKNLKKMQGNHPDYIIWYVNFTPLQTYIYDLDRANLGSPVTVKMNSQTFKSSQYKIPKPVYDISIKEAQIIKYSYKTNPYKDEK